MGVNYRLTMVIKSETLLVWLAGSTPTSKHIPLSNLESEMVVMENTNRVSCLLSYVEIMENEKDDRDIFIYLVYDYKWN